MYAITFFCGWLIINRRDGYKVKKYCKNLGLKLIEKRNAELSKIEESLKMGIKWCIIKYLLKVN